eukprot:Hpha_TRINITY_DN16946_c2_g1::TRINITY_DN16946_c2_g1_i5::g.54501::m.54501
MTRKGGSVRPTEEHHTERKSRGDQGSACHSFFLVDQHGGRDNVIGSPRLPSQEVVEHSEGSLGLVHRHHVARLGDLHEGETLVGDVRADVLAGDGEGRVLRGVEACLSIPLQGLSPPLSAHPVDDEVLVTVVDQHGDVGGEQLSHVLLEAEHPVSSHHQLDLHNAVARVPVRLLRVQGLVVVVEPSLHCGEVVAQRRHLARDANVVEVDTAELHGGDLLDVARVVRVLACQELKRLVDARRAGVVQAARDLLTRRGSAAAVRGLRAEAGRVTGRVPVLARVDQREAVDQPSLHRRDRARAQPPGPEARGVLHALCVGGVLVVLVVGVHQPVADEDAGELDLKPRLRLVLGLDHVRQGGHVVPAVALARDEETVLGVLGEGLEPALEELPHVHRHLRLVGHPEVSGGGVVAEPGTHGLVDVQDVRLRVPRVGVQGDLLVAVDLVRSVLHKQRKLSRAPRPARHPQDEGVVGWVVAGFKEPVEEITRLVHRHVTREVGHRLGTHPRHVL